MRRAVSCACRSGVRLAALILPRATAAAFFSLAIRNDCIVAQSGEIFMAYDMPALADWIRTKSNCPFRTTSAAACCASRPVALGLTLLDVLTAAIRRAQ